MPLPQPAIPLQDQCTIIYKGKLYAYQPNAFQSLELKEGGMWSQLAMGVSTNGSTCAQGSVDGKPALIVVGGSSSEKGYKGLQHYDMNAKAWSSDTPADAVAENRRRHGSAFLEKSSEILVYAGSQDDSQTPSTQTFLISTKSPYGVRAFESSAPPVTNPLMLPLNASHALLVGGDSRNTKLYTFGPEEGWQRLSVDLPSPLKDSARMQATIMTGSDGSKVLEIFDLSASPNQLSAILLQHATSSSKPTKLARAYDSLPRQRDRFRTRDTASSARPAYNSTLAPEDARTGFSLASDSQNGLVVASGGNSQSPLAMFNQTGNQWIDPNTFFGNQPSTTSAVSSATSSATPSATSMSAPAASSQAAANTHVRNKSLTILGGVLGGVFGAAILLIIILFLLRYCRKRRDKKQQQRKSEYALDDKDEPMDFTDIGADFMKEAGGSMTALPAAHQFANQSNHQRMKSAQSDRSVDPRTIDRGMTASSESKRRLLHVKNNSAGSGKSFWSRGTKSPQPDRQLAPQISAPVLGEPLARPAFLAPVDARTEPRRDAGWSRYFTNNESREGLGNRPPPPAVSAGTRPATYLSDSQAASEYTSSRIASSHPHESAEVEPLNFSTTHTPLPTDRGIPPSNDSRPGLGLAITHGPSPERERDVEPGTPTTLASVSGMSESDEDLRLPTSHGDSEGHSSWTPVGGADERTSTWTDDRPFSNATDSRIYQHPGERVEIPNFPMPSARSSAVPSPITRTPQNELQDPFNKGLRNVISKDLAGQRSGRQQATSEVRTGAQRVLPGYGAAEARPFPRPKEQLGARGRGGSQTEDMSWLNLGTSQDNSHHDMYFPGR